MRGNSFVIPLLLIGSMLVPSRAAVAEESDTLGELLHEVRLLRQAMERSTEFAARSQLLTGQLSVQERRLARAQSELDGLDSELVSVTAEQPRLRTILEQLQDASDSVSEPERRRAIEFETKQVELELEQMQTRESEISTQRSRAAEGLDVERDRYEDLDRRLYELERELARPR